MAFDIAAIQYLYGAKTNAHTEDNTYTLKDANAAGTFWNCIWDTGGTDQIVYTGARNVTIDLTAATLDNSQTGGGMPSYASGIHGGFTIANGVVITIISLTSQAPYAVLSLWRPSHSTAITRLPRLPRIAARACCCF